jgi:hypothetical protein
LLIFCHFLSSYLKRIMLNKGGFNKIQISVEQISEFFFKERRHPIPWRSNSIFVKEFCLFQPQDFKRYLVIWGNICKMSFEVMKTLLFFSGLDVVYLMVLRWK